MKKLLRPVLTVVVVVAATAAVAAGLVQVRTDTTTASFLPLRDPSQEASLSAARSFGGDPVVVLAESTDRATLLGPDQISTLAGLEGTLSRLPDVAVVYGPGTVLNQVAGQAQNLLATISGRRDGLRSEAKDEANAAGASSAEVRAAVAASVETFDVRYASLLVKGMPAGLPTLTNSSFVNAVVFDAAGEPRQQWRFVVPRPDAVAIVVRPREELDQASTEELVSAIDKAVDDAGLQTSKVTVTGMPVVASGLGGMLRHEIPVIGAIAMLLIAGCYLLLPWISGHRRRLLPLVASLAAVVVTLSAFGWLRHPVGLGVVAFLPIVLGTGSDFPAYLVRGADRRRVLVTALAAAVSFATLAISPLPFVRDLGIALAAGVVLAAGFGLVVSRRAYRRPDGAARSSPDLAEPPTDEPDARVGEPLPSGIRVALLGLAAVLSLVGWLALPDLHMEARPEKLAEGASSLTQAQYAEGVLGAAGEVQILVRGPNVVSPEGLAWMNAAQTLTLRRYGDQLRPVASPSSLLAFLGASPSAAQIDAGMAQLPAYLRGSVIRDDRKAAVLGFGIKFGDVAAQNELLAGLRKALPEPPAGMTVDLAGLPVVSARSYHLVSENRYLDGLVGIAAAGVVLLIGLRRRSDALRAILAASLATGWALAGAWVLGVALTPLTVALGSLATATACEFSVLLSGSHHGRSVEVRRSVLVAAAAATSGYLALTFSGLALIRSFGLFLAATVILSLLAAQLVRLLLPTRRPAPVIAPPRPISTKTKVLV